MRSVKSIYTIILSVFFAMFSITCVYAENQEVDTEGAQRVYEVLFRETLKKQDAAVVSELDADAAPVVIARLENGKLAYMVEGEAFYPRALETGWWDTRIPDPANNNQTFRTDTDWDYVFQDMKDIGANTVQLMVYWSDWEPQEGVYDYNFLDNVIDKAARQGIKTELIIFLHSHAIPGVIPRTQDDFWGYHLDDKDGKSYTIQWGTGNMNNTPAFRAAAAPGNGKEIFLEYWHPEVYPKLMDALTALAGHYADSPDVIGYQVGNEEGANYYVHGGQDQNPYYAAMKRLYLENHPGAAEREFRIAMINNLWTSMNNAIHAGDAYKPTTSNLQSAITEKNGFAYNKNDGSTMGFYENLDMVGSMFYGGSGGIYSNLDRQYNRGKATNQDYATTFPLLFPTEIGANVNDSCVLKVIAAETMARGGQGFGVYCYGELYMNAKNYKNSVAKPSREYTKNLYSAVEQNEDLIWAGLPVTADNTQNIFITPGSSTNNPTLAVLEKDAGQALGLLYFKGALSGGKAEDRSRDVQISVRTAGSYSVEVLLSNGTVTPAVTYSVMEDGGSFMVPVTTANIDIAFIRVIKTEDGEEPEKPGNPDALPDGYYTIRSADTNLYLATEEKTISGKTDMFVVLTDDEDAAAQWKLEKRADGTYFVLADGKGMNVRFRGNGSNHIVVFDKNDNSNQHWSITQVEDGTYTLTNQNTGRRLDSLGQTEAGALMEQRPSADTVGQRWVITPTVREESL